MRSSKQLEPPIIRKIPDHQCNLECPQGDECLINFISTGFLVTLRRKFRKFLMVSDTNPESKSFFKSTAQIHMEQNRHLKYYYHMIHPFSQFRVQWEVTMIMVYLLLLIIFIPVEISYLLDTPNWIIGTKFLLDFICYMDVIVNFCTGFMNSKTQKIILDPKQVALQYLFYHKKFFIPGFFFTDVISSVPITFLIEYYDRKDLFKWKAILFFKLFRLTTVFKYMKNFCNRKKFYPVMLRPFRIAVDLLIGVFWFTAFSIYLLQATLEEADLENSYLNIDEGFHFLVYKITHIIECLMLVGPDAEPLNSPWQYKLLNVIYIILGSVINMIVLAQILRIYKNRNAARNKQQKFVQEITQYMAYKQMPHELKEKIVKYVEFKYHRKILKEAEIMSNLSEILREEIMLHNCQRLVERVDFFKVLPSRLLIKLVSKLKPEVYLQNEVIFEAGSTAYCMYFIHVGAVSVHTPNGVEMMYLTEGKHVGEIALMNNTPRIYTCIARRDCELLKLYRKDVMELIKPFPMLCAELATMAEERRIRMEGFVSRMSLT